MQILNATGLCDPFSRCNTGTGIGFLFSLSFLDCLQALLSHLLLHGFHAPDVSGRCTKSMSVKRISVDR